MINGFGPAYGYLGYQVHTRKFFQALNRLTPVCLTPANQNSGGFQVDADLREMIARQRSIQTSNPAICIGYGNNFHCFHGAYRIGYRVFEYTKLADDWINGMRQVDEVWTTSRWGCEMIRRQPPQVCFSRCAFRHRQFHPRCAMGRRDRRPWRWHAGPFLSRPARPRAKAGEAYNVGSDQPISIADLAHLVRDLVSPGKPVRILGQPVDHAERNRYVPDIRKSARDLGFQPSISLEQSILDAVEGLRRAGTSAGQTLDGREMRG